MSASSDRDAGAGRERSVGESHASEPDAQDGRAPKKPRTVDFEAALQELERLVTEMESGTLSLEASLKAYERGVQLSRDCQAALRQAEMRIMALTQDGDVVKVDPPGDADQF